MRIVAGTHRGRRLETPADERIRPTADRIREALFSILAHRIGGFGGKRVLDAFAGTGALGLESLSRGAVEAIFMDKDRGALGLARRNAAGLGLTDNVRFLPADATRPPKADMACDLVFLDPPYGEGLGAAALTALDQAGWLTANALVVVEADRTLPESVPLLLPDSVLVLWRRDAVPLTSADSCFAMSRCCCRAGSLSDANCLRSASLPVFCSSWNSLTVFSWSSTAFAA
jgi:16S rRNA (guanine966-N2)-methyltransferase